MRRVSVVKAAARCLVGSTLLVVPSTPAGEPVALRFAEWDLPARATVTETWVLRAGVVGEDPPSDQGAVLRYRIEMTALGEDLRLSFHDFETLELGGVDVTTPALAGWGVTAAYLAMQYPPQRISREGHFLGIVDFESWLETSLARLDSEKPGWSDVDPAQYEDPLARASLEIRSRKRWYAWVAAWMKYDFVPGEVLEITEPIPIGDVTVDAQVLSEHRGRREDGRVALRVVSRLGGETMINALCRIKAEQSGATIPPDGTVPRCADETSGTDTLEVLTSETSLRPSRAKYESRGGGVSGDSRYEHFESRTYTFEWD